MAGMRTPGTDLATRIVQHDYVPPAGFAAPQPGVYKASTVIFPNVAAMRARDWRDKSGYTYGLHGTPTTFTLEERLCTLEGGLQCLLAPSGLAAIANVALALLKPGDELLLPDNVYGPSKDLAHDELARLGISHGLYDPLEPADLAARITPATRLVWLEAPGSVSMEFPDLRELVRICRARAVRTALDNTWGAGLAFAPFDLLGDGSLGVDICVHALTKYPSGGGDVLMGSVITRDAALHTQIRHTHMRLGLGVAGNDAEAVLRGLPSLGLRYRAHDAAARSLALWLQQQPAVAQVLHPALAGSPGHTHWQALCGAGPGGQGLAAGLFSVLIDARHSAQQVDAFCDGLRLFKLGYSWGGPMSLVVPYHIASMRSRCVAHLKQGTLVRFSIGLEAVQDLQQDLQQAMERAFPAA
ncbi:cystathionine beta-lyase [Verminephrobacter aporrectodeae subsp. tuberculatae]|uniref:PLP-dependent transferase n=1 Tax=Verminephrobacter aporrectodeae TaxID=1110389 RepID=UPI002244E139|nr:PLP-dependent transferase [Verminephrobacter aporrectodeae]MCW8198744.1 cystathionine beta-lyase [Verminephrobacter aporrectodeae subsp. tuberculatae]